LSLPVFIRRAAELDLMRAEDWYEAQQPGLGHEFREAVDATIARIAANPLAYPDRYHGAGALLCAASRTSFGTGRLGISSWSLRAFTAGAIPEEPAPDFGDRRTSGCSGPALALLAPAAEPAR
jgi:plasmid stabilization system protein ParE